MTSLVLCCLALMLSFAAGRRSLVAGLATVLGIGYAYGILRANLPQTFSHFIFDAALLGLYAARWRSLLAAPYAQARALKYWVVILTAWPLVLFLVPVQDQMIELVGLRGHIILLPFLLFGAQLGGAEAISLALWVAALNLVAFAFAVAEFFLGVEPFFPPGQAVTDIIYMSHDVAGWTAYRIPSLFKSSHSYGGTMVLTLPLLVGAWVQKPARAWHGYLLTAALVATLLGVFMAAARTHVVALLILLLVVTCSGHVRWAVRVGWVMVLLGLGWVVASEERLQRFTSLGQTDYVVTRLTSVNSGFLELALKHPLGNGLGSASNIPYFLQARVTGLELMENEYIRLLLEQGLPGLLLWLAFILWALCRRAARRGDEGVLGRWLAWFACCTYFAIGLTGSGMLVSIPQTCLLLLNTGWVVRRAAAPATQPSRVSRSAALDQAVWAN